MGRHPDGPAARLHQVNVRLSLNGLTMLDSLRGETPRSTYLRRLLAQEYGRSVERSKP